MKKTYLDKGFTLIELLVVIAIIGILSGIVLASLNTARSKGSDTAVKAGLAAIRSQAEIFYDTGNTYGASATCTTSGAGGAAGGDTGVFGDSVVMAQIVQIKSQLATGGTVVCSTNAGGQKWAVSVSALKGAATTWCVDNSGWNKVGASAAGVCS